MIALAFGLGIAGSLHCLGMCGPLVLSTSNVGRADIIGKLTHVGFYHFGRIMTYGLLGVLFGSIGHIIAIGSFQKVFTILSGLILILIFLMSLDLEKLLFKSDSYRNLFYKVHQKISDKFSNLMQQSPFYIGVFNGLLPCGLVYLALMGSLTTGSPAVGWLFMIAFGVGTLPMMLSVHLGFTMFQFKGLRSLRKVFPVLHLIMGLYLIYRGWMVDMPMEMDFYSAIKNPIMCH